MATSTRSLAPRALVLALLFFFFFLANVAQAVLPNGLCSSEDVTCDFEDDNLVGVAEGVATVDECRQLCEGNATDCKIFSYYGPTSFPFRADFN